MKARHVMTTRVVSVETAMPMREIAARVLDFPSRMPGDVGLCLAWG